MVIFLPGMFIVLQTVAKHMSELYKSDPKKRFSIVNTSSVAGLRGTPAMVAYSSSKAAVLAMTVSASKDLAPFGIRVNSVSPALIGPGYMWTRQNELHGMLLILLLNWLILLTFVFTHLFNIQLHQVCC